VSALPPQWTPANWVDWLIVIAVGSGLLAGLRQGAVLSLAGLAAAAAAVGLAIHFGPILAAAAEAHWHLQRQLADFLQRYMPLPDGSGAVPYSPAALQLFLHQAVQGAGAPQPYLQAISALLHTPGATATATTLGGYIDGLLAQRLLSFAAFLAVLMVGEAVLLGCARLAFGGVARQGLSGVANALGGAALGGLERLVEVSAVLALLAAVSVLPELGGVASALHGSRWAPVLLGALRHLLPPGTPGGLAAWIAWV
jgi:uncharacterized membrane protein required for colicin V production